MTRPPNSRNPLAVVCHAWQSLTQKCCDQFGQVFDLLIGELTTAGDRVPLLKASPTASSRCVLGIVDGVTPSHRSLRAVSEGLRLSDRRAKPPTHLVTETVPAASLRTIDRFWFEVDVPEVMPNALKAQGLKRVRCIS
jgi:hypothetical protein